VKNNKKQKEQDEKDPTSVERLVALCNEAEFFHAPDSTGFATVRIDNHRENWPLKSARFKQWLSRRYYQETGSAPNSQTMRDAIGTVEGRALWDGQEHSVFNRVGEKKGAIYLDLVNDNWQVVEITAAGWTVLDESPVKFRRTKGMLPLPLPSRGSSIDLLRRFVNVDGENAWKLLVSWLVAALRHRGPFPIAVINGEQGSAKSTTLSIMRELTDPNVSELRGEPTNIRDLMISAKNSWVISFDNMSHIEPWLSDAFCRLSTGGGFSTRSLFENDEEEIFDAQRPIIINGIEELATRSDLLDRSLMLHLPTIPPDKRRDDKQFWSDFAAVRPAILGALLDAVAVALANIDSVNLPALPRLAGFAIWVTAAEPAFGWEPLSFIRAYNENRNGVNDLALEASPITAYVRTLADEVWTSTATTLLKKLREIADPIDLRHPGWPKTAKSLSGILKRLAPNFRATGVEIEFWRSSSRERERMVTIGRRGSSSETSDSTDEREERTEEDIREQLDYEKQMYRLF
jgi:hypothetical protein